MTRRDANEAVVAQEGLNTLAEEQEAVEGDVPTVGSDGKVSFAGPGGGGAPITRALYGNGGGDVVPENVYTPLTWQLDQGDALLTLTVPTVPVIVAAGTYSVAVAVTESDDATLATHFAYVELITDGGGDSASVFQTMPLASDAGFDPTCALTLTRYIGAGHSLKLHVQHAVAGGLNFVAAMSVQRLS